MMSPEWLGASARYNRWMNDKLYALAATLSDEARKRDLGAFFKSIHGILNHLLIADRVWLARFKGETLPDGHMGPGGIRSLDQDLYANFDDLRRERALTDDELSAWVTSLTPEQLAAPLVYLRRGQKLESPLWWSVAHLFTHQTHHRGQLTTLFTQIGHDVGVTDMIAMLREQGTGSTGTNDTTTGNPGPGSTTTSSGPGTTGTASGHPGPTTLAPGTIAPGSANTGSGTTTDPEPLAPGSSGSTRGSGLR